MATKKLQIIGGGLESLIGKSFVVSFNAPTDTNLLWIDPQEGLKYYNTEKKEWGLADPSSGSIEDIENALSSVQDDLKKLNGMTTTKNNKTVINGSDIDFSTVSNGTIAADKIGPGTGEVNIQSGTGLNVNLKSSGGSGSSIVLSPSYIQLMGNALALQSGTMYGTSEPSDSAKEGTLYFQVVG